MGRACAPGPPGRGFVPQRAPGTKVPKPPRRAAGAANRTCDLFRSLRWFERLCCSGESDPIRIPRRRAAGWFGVEPSPPALLVASGALARGACRGTGPPRGLLMPGPVACPSPRSRGLRKGRGGVVDAPDRRGACRTRTRGVLLPGPRNASSRWLPDRPAVLSPAGYHGGTTTIAIVLGSAVQVGSGALCLVGLSRHHELVCGDWTVPSPGRDT